MTASKVIRRLLVEAGEIQVWSSTPALGNCIMTTAIGIDALHAFGIDAEPLPVHLKIANPPLLSWFEAGQVGDPPPDARSLVSREVPEAGGLGGHLVVHVPTQALVLDLDLRSWARPEKQIVLPPVASFAWPAGRTEGRYRLGACGVFLDATGDRRYEESSWWRNRGQYAAVVAELVRAIRKGGAR